MLSDEQIESFRLGASIMTAWCEYKDGIQASEQLTGLILTRIATEDGLMGLIDAVVGVQNVAGILIGKVADSMGLTHAEVLQKLIAEVETGQGPR